MFLVLYICRTQRVNDFLFGTYTLDFVLSLYHFYRAMQTTPRKMLGFFCTVWGKNVTVLITCAP